ncbi:MAG: hypothetical protein U5J63_10850 [Fodinibius sp.]|nr:hypothetical protein [Fodinibius sp.]
MLLPNTSPRVSLTETWCSAAHGRGIFYGEFDGTTSARFVTAQPI